MNKVINQFYNLKQKLKQRKLFLQKLFKKVNKYINKKPKIYIKI